MAEGAYNLHDIGVARLLADRLMVMQCGWMMEEEAH
ncbi:ABC-type phosphonate transport system ATPase subunit [Bradyrhizobium sp. USDA 4501]